ncbi:hypothetical protein A2U01_0064355, partial [Trifolium medium]|nr:hypothetical protein [Trifolium medium]
VSDGLGVTGVSDGLGAIGVFDGLGATGVAGGLGVTGVAGGPVKGHHGHHQQSVLTSPLPLTLVFA